MKKLLLALCLITFLGNSQNLAFQWAKNLGGTNSEAAYGVVADAAGNVYSTGVFIGTTDFDPGVGTFTLTSSFASADIFVSKLDAAGNFVWAKNIGNSGTDNGQAIATDASGNVYVTGYFTGTVDFDPGAGVFNLTSVAGSNDIFILKLNSAGSFVGAFAMGGASNETAYSITVDTPGNIYTTGYYQGSADFDPGITSSSLTAVGGPDIFVSKLDASGNFVWAKSFGGSSANEEGHGIKVDALGNVYFTGFFAATADFDPSPATFNLTSNGSSDNFVTKLNSSGNLVWAKQMGGTSADKSYWITLDGSGNAYTTGFFSTTVDFDPGPGTANLTVTGLNDGFISKLDASGNYVWAQSISTNSYVAGNGIAVDASNNVYVTGFFQGTTDFDPGLSTYSVTSAGSLDAFILKLDASGNFVTAKTFGSTGADNSTSIALDASNNVFTTGYFAGTVDFDPGPGVANITIAGGGSDVFVHKMIPCTQPAPPVNNTVPNNLTICSNNSTTLTTTGSGTITWYSSPTSTTVLSTGLNYVTPILSSGTFTYYAEALTCMNSATRTAINITVNATPTISVNSGTLCNGNSFTITPSGASSYTYQNSTVGSSCVISPSSLINFSLVGTSVAGCTNTAVSSITVFALPTINISCSTGGPTICSGNTATLFAGGASTYSWVSGPNTFTYAISPTVFTTYTVVGTSSVGCSSSNTISIGILTTPTVNINTSSSNICNGSSTTLTANGASSYAWNTGANTSSISVSPTTSIIYTVTGTSSGCTDTETISITVTSNPTISIASTATSICTGGSATLTIIGSAASYTWNTGPTTTAIVVSPTANTSYTAAGFNGSCYGIATTSILISNSISVNAASSSPSICIGQTATLTANGAATYTWDTGSNLTSIIVSPSVAATTIYTVSGNSGSCFGTTTLALVVSSCAGIKNNELENSFISIFPNPNNGSFTILVNKTGTYNLVNTLGQTVKTINISEQEYAIKINNLSSGIYYFIGNNSVKKLSVSN